MKAGGRVFQLHCTATWSGKGGWLRCGISILLMYHQGEPALHIWIAPKADRN
jgi:hypothetical protein